MTRSILRTIFTLFIAVSVTAGILSVPATSAWFTADGESRNNSYRAGNLNLVLEGDEDIDGEIEPGDKVTRDVTVRDGGSIEFRYKAETGYISGELCSSLKLKAFLEEEEIYDDRLGDFEAEFRQISGDSDDWKLEIYFAGNGASNMDGSSCEFSLDFKAQQVDMDDHGFSDRETINGNINFTHPSSQDPGDSGEVKEGDVVINEIMWMGSTVSGHDEWIELRNTTNREINIGQWKIDNARTGTSTYNIPASHSIPAKGYFLIANYPENSNNTALNVGVDQVNNSISLANSDNGNLVLKDKEGNIIDQVAGGSSWPKGVYEGSDDIHRSMERNDSPGDGLDVSNWHTCMDEACNDTTYWKSEGNNYGTPGYSNLSEK